MSAETRQPLQPLSLASLASSGPGPPPRSVFRGRVTSIRPYSPHTRLAQLTLASLDSTDPPQTTLEVELMGDVAFKASRRLHKGDTLILSTKGLVALPAKGKGKEGGKARPPRVRFERELLGWIRRAKNGDEEFLHYRGASSTCTAGVPCETDTCFRRPQEAKDVASASLCASASRSTTRLVTRSRRPNCLGYRAALVQTSTRTITTCLCGKEGQPSRRRQALAQEEKGRDGGGRA